MMYFVARHSEVRIYTTEGEDPIYSFEIYNEEEREGEPYYGTDIVMASSFLSDQKLVMFLKDGQVVIGNIEDKSSTKLKLP